MIYRTFKATTYKEAVLKAKMEMGSNVYILGRKEIKEGGFLGMFKKTTTEITVAKNEELGKPGEKKETVSADIKAESLLKTVSSKQNKLLSKEGKTDDNSNEVVLKELKDIKTRLEEIADIQSDKPYLEKLIHVLNNNDFSGDFIEQIRRKFEDELSLKEVQDPKVLEEKFRGYLMESIVTSGPIELGKGRPSVVVLVGPTGVGKTTTIAKLAATYGVIQKRKVELVTIDSYRIAAIEQLGKYAELMQIPFNVVNSREEFKNIIMNSKSEIIFVDTAGRSQKNNLGLAEMRNILDGVKTNLDIHLVLSATTKYHDAVDIMARFNQLMYNKVIITKMDETNKY